jgi:2-polyprenyl-6-methoxyphenol hydroxylase-like FAD-dependent oxidoreductase
LAKTGNASVQIGGQRALVIGGSMSGLFAALALARRGWDVHVFERVEIELAGRGAGIVAQPQLHEVLRDIGLDPSAELGVPVELRRSYDADGLRSTVRAQMLPEAVPLYAGYVAWRALVPEAALSPATRRDLFGYMAFCHPPGEQALGYAVTGPDNDLRAGHRSYNLVWYRPADEDTELPRLLTDAAGTVHSISIPPPLIRAEVIAEMRAAAERLLAPQFREVVRLAAQPFIQPIYDVAAARMAFGRVALLGDAAFVARPHVAIGVAKAAEDALALAESIEQCGDIERGLARFESLRIGVGRRVIERARHLGAYLQSRARSAEERLRAEQHRAPEAVLAETAVLDFLQE